MGKPKCSECHRDGRTLHNGITLPKPLCNYCFDLEHDSGEVDDPNRIRCPHCRHIWQVDADDGVCGDGVHDTFCGMCGKEFHVITNISVTYTSPAIEAPR